MRMDVPNVLPEDLFAKSGFFNGLVILPVLLGEFVELEVDVALLFGFDKFGHRVERVYVLVSGARECTAS